MENTLKETINATWRDTIKWICWTLVAYTVFALMFFLIMRDFNIFDLVISCKIASLLYSAFMGFSIAVKIDKKDDNKERRLQRFNYAVAGVALFYCCLFFVSFLGSM